MTERIISVFCFLLVMVLSCFSISIVKGNNYKKVLFVYLIILGIFAWNYDPGTNDLSRLRIYVQFWNDMSWNRVIDYAFTRADPVWVIYAWMINIFENQNWLHTLPCILGIGIVFITISDMITNFHIVGHNRGWLLFFLMSTGELYILLLANIRTCFGICIIFYCIYKEYFNNRLIIYDIPLYIIAMGFHPFCIFIVAIRMFFFAISGKGGIIKGIFNLLFALAVLAIAIYYGEFFIKAMQDKYIAYTTNAGEYSYIWVSIISICQIIVNIGLLIWYFTYKNIYKYTFGSYALLTLGTTMVCVFCIPLSYAMFTRLTIMAGLLALPLFSLVLSRQVDESDCNDYKLRITIKILIIFLFMLSYLRGNISFYTFSLFF